MTTKKDRIRMNLELLLFDMESEIQSLSNSIEDAQDLLVSLTEEEEEDTCEHDFHDILRENGNILGRMCMICQEWEKPWP